MERFRRFLRSERGMSFCLMVALVCVFGGLVVGLWSAVIRHSVMGAVGGVVSGLVGVVVLFLPHFAITSKGK
jgi:hypothetical protein